MASGQIGGIPLSLYFKPGLLGEQPKLFGHPLYIESERSLNPPQPLATGKELNPVNMAKPVGIALVLLLAAGCGAAYSKHMLSSLKRLEQSDYQGALAKLEKPDGKTNKLLYRFEKGLIHHYQGEYHASNAEFEKAEGLIDRLYTRSISRELAALVTNDAIRAYSGEEFERAFIHYYRAMNYCYLNDLEAALVECRKVNQRLADFAQKAEYKLTYKNDAFIQYMTGLLYEAAGEWNDAYISYKDAEKGYRAYSRAFGMAPPKSLGQDLVRLARRFNYADEVQYYTELFALDSPKDWSRDQGRVVVFAETGFVPRKRQWEIDLPLFENDDTERVWHTSDRLVHRYRQPRYRRHHYRGEVDYWLRVALPIYRSVPSQVNGARLLGAGRTAWTTPLEDLGAIAELSLTEKEDTILLRTLARALAKYVISKKAEDKSEWLGALFNLFGTAVEAADTRSWLSLPGAIAMARLEVPAGTNDLVLEFLDGRGKPVETRTFSQIEVAAGQTVFLNARSFR